MFEHEDLRIVNCWKCRGLSTSASIYCTMSGYHYLLGPYALYFVTRFHYITYYTLLFIAIHRHLGKVAFVGTVHYAKGTYVGVIMDIASVGKNNGSYLSILCVEFVTASF